MAEGGLLLEAEKDDDSNNCTPSLRNAVCRLICGVSSLKRLLFMALQGARDCLLGCLFAYGALAPSGRLTEMWISNKNTPYNRELTSLLITIAAKKQYLQESAVSYFGCG
ncbi:hypothetical protein L1049_015614 [Liquidambar formosana]|uniref:Uncharacterized protein n=1 Tax=Liquidambar formosana TaxID=63359 RepID=A0AAP0RYC9_LIQFO